MSNLRVAFIGFGIMGSPMAGHLLRAGCALTVYNRTKSKADALIDAPVSGGDVGARNATLSIMCGGDKNAFGAVASAAF